MDPAKPVRLLNTVADCITALVLWGIPRERAEELVLQELRWRLFPAGEQPVMAAGDARDAIERMKREAPF